MNFYLISRSKHRVKLAFKVLLTILSFLFLSLILSMPVFANPDDWGMVQRFNKQLNLANQGNVKAMYDVGKLYERGRGVVRDMSKAADFFKQSANAGNPSAQGRLGILYFEGRGVKQDYKKSVVTFKLSCK